MVSFAAAFLGLVCPAAKEHLIPLHDAPEVVQAGHDVFVRVAAVNVSADVNVGVILPARPRLVDHAASNLAAAAVAVVIVKDRAGLVLVAEVEPEADETRKRHMQRGLASPDAADAIAVTFAFPIAHREARVDKRRTSSYSPQGISTSWMGS